MPGYFGTDLQKDLQARVENAMPWIEKTPGACNPGRFLGTDDPSQLGWENIVRILERDQIFSFQLVPSTESLNISKKLATRHYRIDYWEVFVAEQSQAQKCISPILNEGLSSEFHVMPTSELRKSDNLLKIQSFLAENDIAPFSTSMLAGEFGPVTTVAICNDAGEFTAFAHGYYPHKGHNSAHYKNAWGGLVAVSPDHRGKGLGRFVNALMVSNCITKLGAEYVHQFVASSNLPSRRMVEASGLKHESNLLCGLAIGGTKRFTR